MRSPNYKLTVVVVIITSVIIGCNQPPREIGQAIAQLHDKNERRREIAAITLGRLGRFTEQPAEQQKAVVALKAALQDASPDVRSAAACSLGLIGYPAKEAVPDLVKLLQEQDDVIRVNAASNLYVIAREAKGRNIPGAREAVKELLKTLADSDEWARSHAVGGLVALAPDDEKVMKRVVTMLSDQNVNVRMQTLESLGSLGAKATKYVPSIRPLLHDKESGIRERAEKTLNSITEK